MTRPYKPSYSSMTQAWWDAWFLAYKLPAPQREVVFDMSEDGRLYRFDLAYVEAKIGFEIHGGIWMKSKTGHTSGSGRLRDMQKSRHAQLLGWMCLEVATEEVESGELAVIAQQALATRIAERKG